MKINLRFAAGIFVFSIILNAAQANSTVEGSFESGRVKIFYQDSQTGKETVVLLHGYAMDHNMWLESGIKDSLAKNYRVITLDMRGHGNSDSPTHTSDYGPKMGLDVINLLDHLSVDKAHVVGFSMGAYVVGRLLVTHPDRISSAVFCSGGFPVQNEQEKEFQDMTADHMAEDGEHALASVARGWALDAVTEAQIEKIETPLLAVFGSQEIDQNIQRQIALFSLPISAKKPKIIEGADHDSEKAAVLHPEFLSALESFLASQL